MATESYGNPQQVREKRTTRTTLGAELVVANVATNFFHRGLFFRSAGEGGIMCAYVGPKRQRVREVVRIVVLCC